MRRRRQAQVQDEGANSHLPLQLGNAPRAVANYFSNNVSVHRDLYGRASLDRVSWVVG